MPTPRVPGQPAAPDPALAGPIRNIVKDAHKWGGDGAKPKFDKIKRVLMTKHPEVIAKAFGGKPDIAAAWIIDNWSVVHGVTYACSDGSRSPQCWRVGGKKKTNLSEDETVPDAIALTEDQIEQLADTTHELFFADKGEATEDADLVWKDILMTGKWKVHPIHGEKGGPFVIDEPYLQQLVDNFDAKAWEHVTVPLSHKDQHLENTGYVQKLVIQRHPERRGHKVLRAGIKFTDHAVKHKVLEGSMANVSVGIDEGEVLRPDGKKFSRVLKHLALTNMPWMKGLRPFGDPATMFTASEVADGGETKTMVLDDETETSVNGDADTAADFKNKVRDFLLGQDKGEEEVDAFLADLTIPDGLTPEEAERHLSELASLADEADDTEDDTTPPGDGGQSEDDQSDASRKDDTPDDNPNDHPEGGDISMSDDNKPTGDEGQYLKLTQEELDAKIASAQSATQIELEALRAENHARRVKETLTELQDKGHFPAVLTAVKPILLGDVKGEKLITMSEDGEETSKSATDIVLSVLDAIPADTLLKFSEPRQRLDKAPAGGTPTAKELAEQEYEALYGE